MPPSSSPLSDLDRLIQLLGRLPGLGPRSAQRAVLAMMKRRDSLMLPLATALQEAADKIRSCETCGNLDTQSPCYVCQDSSRDTNSICVIEDVADLWAMERTRSFHGGYHVLGGHLSAMDGIGPEQLNISSLIKRAEEKTVSEVILALSATADGQITAHYLTQALEPTSVKVTRLALGLPIGGEVNYLDEGTLITALKARQPLDIS